jgi:hypothetical protein
MREQEELIYDLTIKAGDNYSVDFDYTDDDEVSVDVSGWTVESQIREYPEAINAIAFTGTADASGYHLSMDAETTRKLRFAQGVYDVFITDGSGIRSKLIEGHVTVIPEVTR